MSNMSYCRFENTYKDLSDCYEYMDDNLSESEAKYKERIIKLAKRITENYSDDN